jgi:hypothetical protein
MRQKRSRLAAMPFPGIQRRAAECCPELASDVASQSIIGHNPVYVTGRLIPAELGEAIGAR